MIRILTGIGLVLVCGLIPPRLAAAERVVFVEKGTPVSIHETGEAWTRGDGFLEGSGKGNVLFGGQAVASGDFRVRARLRIVKLDGTAAAFQLGTSYFGFDGGGRTFYTNGPIFGGKVTTLGPNAERLKSNTWFDFEATRSGKEIRFSIDGQPVHKVEHDARMIGSVGFYPLRARMQISEFSAEGVMIDISTEPRGYTIPTIDLAHETHRQVIVDKEPGQYLGHPTTVLLENGKTIIAVYPQGHGGGAIVMRRSEDGGLTWSNRLPVPENWATSKEVPTLYRVVDPQGVKRLIMFSGLYPIRMAVSKDDGHSWTPLESIGDYGGIVAMGDLVRLKNGDYMTFFHDDGRFFRAGGKRTNKVCVYKTVSRDGGLTWGPAEEILHHPEAHLCEPGLVRSPDGNQLAMLMRENSRQFNSFVSFSDDEGATWSTPRELPAALTGDRHQARYAPDGRLFITFRDTTHETPTQGDWVGWVGTYEDIVEGREGQYRIRLMDNHHGGDCAYPGNLLLPDGTFVATTYGHWVQGEKPFICSVRFKMEELDAKAKLLPEHNTVFTSGKEGYAQIRIPSVVVSKKGTVLAFAEGRVIPSDHAENDIILKRSTDSGKTWGALQVVQEDGKNCLGNPTALALRDSGRILVMYQRYPFGFHEREVVPGHEGDRICRSFLTHSDDDGATWSEPRDLTRFVKRPTHVTSLASGPGVGIQLRRGPHKGRIVFPFNQGPWGEWKVYAAYSDDGGETWAYGETAPDGAEGRGNEVQMVELADGSILLNSRSHGGTKCRRTALSKGGGQTWSPLADAPALIEPCCMGSIVRCSDPLDEKKSRLVFANPASTESRVNGTIRLSYDEGQTWPHSRSIAQGSFAYSCLTVLPDGTIGCLYETDGYGRIVFARVRLDWLTRGQDGP